MDSKTFRELVRRLERGAYRNGFNHGSGVRGASLDSEDHHSGWFALLSYASTLPAPGADTDAHPAEVALHEALFQLKDIGDDWRRHWESEPLFYHASWALYRLADQLRDFITDASAPAVEAIPSEPQPQQDLKTLLKDWVKETSTRLGQIDNDRAYSGEPNGDTAVRMMWCLQKRFDCLYRRLDGVPSEE